MNVNAFIVLIGIIFLNVSCKNKEAFTKKNISPSGKLIIEKILVKDIPWLINRLPDDGTISYEYIDLMGELTFDNKNFAKSDLYKELYANPSDKNKLDQPTSFYTAFKLSDDFIECTKNCANTNLSTITAIYNGFFYQIQYFCDQKNPSIIDRCGIFGLYIDYINVQFKKK